MINLNHLQALIAEQRREITGLTPSFLLEFPVEDYLREVNRFSKYSSPLYISPKLNQAFEKIGSRHDAHVLSSYHKLALSSLISDSWRKLESENWPQSIKSLSRAWFERAVKDLSGRSDDYFSQTNGLFLMDLAVCSLRAVPVGGAWLVTLGKALGRLYFFRLLGRLTGAAAERFLKKSKDTDSRYQVEIAAVLQYLRVILSKSGGFKPYYIIHSFGRYLPRFTAREMEQAYLRIAELLALDPEIKGILRSSWFLDPALAAISPELAYLKEVPVQNGASLFRMGRDPSLINNAVALSSLRKKLFLEGKYLPIRYAYIWPRADLLKWADRKKKTEYSSQHLV